MAQHSHLASRKWIERISNFAKRCDYAVPSMKKPISSLLINTLAFLLMAQHVFYHAYHAACDHVYHVI